MDIMESQQIAEEIDGYYIDLESQIMQNIAKHLSDWGQPIASDEWQIRRLAEIGKLDQEHIAMIAKMSGISQTAAIRMLNETAEKSIKTIDRGLQKAARDGLAGIPVVPKKSRAVKEVMQTYRMQAKDALNTCCTVMLYKARAAYVGLVNDITNEAHAILSSSATSVVSGVESRQQAVVKCIRKFCEKGIPAFVDKAGREWTPEAYVNMCMRNTAKRVADEAQDARCREAGVNLILIDSHSGARPKCAKDQGKVFDLNNGSGYTQDLHGKKIRFYPWTSSSYGDPDGILGINCRHHKWPFIPGVSVQRYFPTEDTAENNRLYKQTQIQRALERDVRKQKRLCMMYDASGNEEAFEEAAVKLKGAEKKLKGYVSNTPGLHRRSDRERVVGFDKRISAEAVAKNKSYTKAMKTDTIKLKDTYIVKTLSAKGKNYKVVDKTTGIEYEFVPGSRIQDSEVFAGKGTRHPLHEGVAEGLTEQYGGQVSDWQHAKGFGTLLDPDTGEELEAEVHWFQAKDVGKVKFKVKEWLDES